VPLIPGKSNKSFEHNIKAEMAAGKPMKQSLAIAYAAKKLKKKMAKGGEVYPDGKKSIANYDEVIGEDGKPSEMGKDEVLMKHPDQPSKVVDKNTRAPMLDAKSKKTLFADGGEVDANEQEKYDRTKNVGGGTVKGASGADIMKPSTWWAKGGEVENEDEHPMHEDSEDMETENIGPEHLSKFSESHDDLPEPKEMSRHVFSDREDEPEYMHGDDELIKSVLRKRGFAGGGEIPEEDRHVDSPWTDPKETNSLHMDDDFLSEDESMNDDMGNDPKMKRKGVLAAMMAKSRP
jgi:hypothetical protein